MKYCRIIFPLLLISSAFGGNNEKLYVFYPVTTRPNRVQELLQENLKGVTVTVFGRVNDFKARIAADPPDAILTKTALIEQIDGYTVSINGIRNDSAKETYILLSIDKPIDTKSMKAEMVIGVIDVLGRNTMRTFASRLLPVVPKLKQVTKVEDLLPLLMFSLADGILIESVFVDYFKSTSNLTFLASKPLHSTSGIVALAYKDNSVTPGTVTAILLAGNAVVNKPFEVEMWK